MVHNVTLCLQKALLDARALKALAVEEQEPKPELALDAAELLRAIQEHLDRAQWDQKVRAEVFAGHFEDPIEPVGGVSADSYHALAFALTDKIFQDISYVVSCAARDDARRGIIMRLYDDGGTINTKLLQRHWRYVREYLQSSRCPDFAHRAEAILAMMEDESSLGASIVATTTVNEARESQSAESQQVSPSANRNAWLD